MAAATIVTMVTGTKNPTAKGNWVTKRRVRVSKCTIIVLQDAPKMHRCDVVIAWTCS